MSTEDRGGEGPASLWAASGQYMGLGLTWAMATLLFLAVGWWLDTKLGTAPWLLIVGAFVGASAGFYYLYQNVVVEAREEQQAREEQKARKEQSEEKEES